MKSALTECQVHSKDHSRSSVHSSPLAVTKRALARLIAARRSRRRGRSTLNAASRSAAQQQNCERIAFKRDVIAPALWKLSTPFVRTVWRTHIRPNNIVFALGATCDSAHSGSLSGFPKHST